MKDLGLKMKIASGIFMWDATERRSNRYGLINVVDKNYNNDATALVTLDIEQINKLEGNQVKLHAIVHEIRESGHCGDLFLKVSPSTPEVNEQIELGVGTFVCDENACGIAIGLKPSDNRKELWLDPRVLYRLHDQTVSLYAEITSELDHVVKPFNNIDEEIIESYDEEGGFIQIKGENIVGAQKNMTSRPVPGVDHTFEIIPGEGYTAIYKD